VAVAATCCSSVSSCATDMQRYSYTVCTYLERAWQAVTVCTQNNGVTKDWAYVRNKEAVLLSG